MAVALLNVIGVAAGALTMLPYLEELFAPPAASKDATVVRIVLGSDTDEAASLSGNTPGASLWDFNGNAIGYTKGKSEVVPQGNFVDITINPRAEAGNIQAQYISISNGGNDAICIAGLAVTFPDGGKAAFSTNIAAECDAAWHVSGTPVLGQLATGEIANPRCIWLDRDGSYGLPHQGMGLHIPSFSNSNENLSKSYTRNKDLMCKSGPRFRMYPKLKAEDSILVFPHPPEFVTDSDNSSLIGTDKDPGFIINNPGILADDLIKGSAGGRGRRRDIRHRHNREPSPALSGLNGTQTPPPHPLTERLIISPHTFNSARELCESWNSFGQSLVSLPENLFCDMTDKSLYYTCSEQVTSCCLDIDETSFRACQEVSIRPPTSQVDGTSAHSGTLRTRQASDELDSSWMKGDKAYDSVQRW